MYSDTDEDEFSNNKLSFQQQNTFQNNSRALNINSNLTRFNFGNLTSSLKNPWNYNKPRYAESVCDQRSMHRRELSPPMSLRSASGFQPRNIHRPYYQGAMSSQRSLYNGRSGSPMSVRTVDSNTSRIAYNIAEIFKTEHFNKYESRIIADAYNQHIKKQIRKRFGKRRKLIRVKHGLGGESGEEGSNSSISGDEGRSIRSFRTIYSGRNREEGSNSSISEDECRSTRSHRTIYGGREYSQSCRSTRTDLTDLRRTMQDNILYKDSTANFQNNSFRNMLSVPPRRVQDSYCRSNLTVQNNPVMTQKDRFQNRFLLPSQRFNQSTVPVSLSKKMQSHIVNSRLNVTNWSVQNQKMPNIGETHSEQEEIFSNRTVVETSLKNTRGSQSKRPLDDDTNIVPEKRIKLQSPQRLKEKSKAPTPKKKTSKGTTNDFVFAKPQFPIKKISNVKNSQDRVTVKPTQATNELPLSSSQPTVETQQERTVTDNTIFKSKKPAAIEKKSQVTKITQKLISQQLTQQPKKKLDSESRQPEQLILKPQANAKLISKSSHPLDHEVHPEFQKITQVNEQERPDQSETQHSTSNVSMRPSFIKRKLFTQKVIEDGNLSCSSDNAETNSQVTNIYSDIQNEKNKARRLVTSQFCLSRDIRDDSNYLDLIHKVVPPEHINLTTTMNHTKTAKIIPTFDKFDVNEVLSKYSTEDLSDTYTDEEIFKEAERTKVETKKKKFGMEEENYKNGLHVKKTSNVKQNGTLNQPKVLVEKIGPQIDKKSVKEAKNDPKTTVANTGLKRSVLQCVKSFWDSDVESDFQNQGSPSRKSKETYAKVTSNEIDRAKDQDIKEQCAETIATIPEKQTNVNKTRTAVNKTTTTIDENHNSSKRIRKPVKPVNENAKNQDINKKCAETIAAVPEEQTAVNKTRPTVNIKTAMTITENHNSSKRMRKPVDENKNIKTKQAQPKTRTDKALEATQNKNVSHKTNKSHDKNYTVITSNLRIRQPRTPKIRLCCEPTSEQSLNNTSETLYKSLRSREVDISPSPKSDKSTKKREAKKGEVAKNKNLVKMRNFMDNSESDFSFTLQTSVRTRRAIQKAKNNVDETKMRTRQSDK